MGKGGGVRPLVALEPLGDRGAGVVGEPLLLDLEARDCGGGDEGRVREGGREG